MSYLARTVTLANGSQTTFPVSFAFEKRADVEVYVYSDPAAPGSAVTGWTWVSDGQIAFSVPPAVSHFVDVRRASDISELDNTFTGGALSSALVTQNDQQLLYLLQEREDEAMDLRNQLETLRTHPSVTVNGALLDGFPLPVVTPKMFQNAKPSGVLGDGTDDSPALNAMSAAINILGGGTVVFDPSIQHWIGSQLFNGPIPALYGGGVWTFAPASAFPMEFSGCHRGLVIMGLGASIKCLAGAKYGAFNEDASARSGDSTGFAGATGIVGRNAATPYAIALYVHDCSGFIDITGLDINGNNTALVIGGTWGGPNIQIPCSGLHLKDNTGRIRVDITTNYHGLDGIIGDGPGLKNVKEDVIIRATSEYNGRQGLSMVGGNGWHLDDGSSFSHTGKGGLVSSPGAGIDVEAEGGKFVLNSTAGNIRCEDNFGPGLNSDTNSFVRGFVGHGGRYVGTTAWSLWPFNPGFKFYDPLIIGSIANPYPSDDPTDAFEVSGGKWTDDVTLSPTGAVYGVTTPATWLAFGSIRNVTFRRTHILKTAAAVDVSIGAAPASLDADALLLEDCTVENLSPTTCSMIVYGIYKGTRTRLKDVNSMPSQDADALFLFNAGPAVDSFYWSRANAPGNFTSRLPASCDPLTGSRISYGAAPPTTGTWAIGDKRYNNDPASTESIGWVCTVAGTPGTWNGFGTIA